MKIIIPSILEKTEEQFRVRLQVIEQFATTAQLDVLDHSFIAYRSFCEPEVIDAMQPKIPIEIHFMTTIDSARLAAWNKPWVNKMFIHLKAVDDPRPWFAEIRQMGKLPGLALNPETTLLEAKPYLSEIDTLLIMGVNPGRSGQELLPACVEKVRRLRKLNSQIQVEFDGGVNDQTAGLVARSGVDFLVVGSFLTNEKFAANYQLLQEIANGQQKVATLEE